VKGSLWESKVRSRGTWCQDTVAVFLQRIAIYCSQHEPCMICVRLLMYTWCRHVFCMQVYVHSIPFRSISFRSITLHYITLHCITLHYITVHTLHARIHAYMHRCIHAYIHACIRRYLPSDLPTYLHTHNTLIHVYPNFYASHENLLDLSLFPSLFACHVS